MLRWLLNNSDYNHYYDVLGNGVLHRAYTRTFSRTFWSYYKWKWHHQSDIIEVTSSRWHHLPTFFHLLQTWSPSYNFGLSSKCPKFY